MPCRQALLKQKLESVTTHVTYFLEVGESTDESDMPGSPTGIKNMERQVHEKLFNQIFGIGYKKKYRLRKLHRDLTKRTDAPRIRKHEPADVLHGFLEKLPREECHYSLASKSLYLTSVNSHFDVFKAYLDVHEHEMLETMAGLNFWGHSISGRWGKERQAKHGDEPKPLCSYDYVRMQFNKYRDGPDKYMFQPRRTDQCTTCNKIQDKINVLSSLGVDCDEDLAQLNAHREEKEKHLEGADQAYFRLRNYREVSRKSYRLAGNSDNALLGATLM